MNNSELAKEVALATGLTQKDVASVIAATALVVTKELYAGNEVAINDFGKFSVADRAERLGRNPANGETVVIAASKAPKFKASVVLKRALNQ